MSFYFIYRVIYQRHEPGDSDFTEAADLKDNDNEVSLYQFILIKHLHLLML